MALCFTGVRIYVSGTLCGLEDRLGPLLVIAMPTKGGHYTPHPPVFRAYVKCPLCMARPVPPLLSCGKYPVHTACRQFLDACIVAVVAVWVLHPFFAED